MPQCGTQWRDPRAHRHKNQIASPLCGQIETVARDAEQFNPAARLQIKERNTGADTAFDKNLNFSVFRRAGESEVSRLLVIHAQDPDLAGNEIDAAPVIFIRRDEIERPGIASLITHVSNDQKAWLLTFHFLAGDLSV